MSESLDSLLRDADLILHYGIRSGRLRQDALINVTARLRSGTREPGPQDVALLQMAIRSAVRDIHPVTLLDLRDWNPFERLAPADGGPEVAAGPEDASRPRGPRRRTMTAAALASVLAIFTTVSYTSWYTAARDTLILYDQISARTRDRLNSPNLLVLAADLNRAQEPITAGAGTEELWTRANDTIADYRDLDLARSLVIRSHQEWNLSVLVRAWRLGETWISRVFGSLETASAPPSPVTSVSEVRSNCADDAVDHRVTANSPLLRLMTIAWEIRNFQCNVVYPLQYADQQGQFDRIVESIKVNVKWTGDWMLPACYGMLGALMFFMRAFLDRMLPDPHPSTVLNRIVLGAFCGIVVSSLFSPSLPAFTQLSAVGVGAFALAFLAGFSVEMIILLLDRLVRVGTQAIGRIGREQGPPTRGRIGGD